MTNCKQLNMFLITLKVVILVLIFGRITEARPSQVPSDKLSLGNDNGNIMDDTSVMDDTNVMDDIDDTDDKGAMENTAVINNAATNFMSEIPKENLTESLDAVTRQSRKGDHLNDTDGTDSKSVIGTDDTESITNNIGQKLQGNSTVSFNWDSDTNMTTSLEIGEDEMEENEMEEDEMEEDEMEEDEMKQTRRSGCPKIGSKPKRRKSLVKCYCRGDQIWENGRCTHYKDKLFIDVQTEKNQSKTIPVGNYEVIVEDVSCHTHRNFTKGQFHLRSDRGDIVLLKAAGELEGQGISDYCVIHQLDDDGNLTWLMKGCVPVPSIPRCCVQGKAMKKGSCQPVTMPYNLTPPIFTSPERLSVEWPHITYNLSTLTCQYELLKPIPLSIMNSYLLSLADGIAYAWKPLEDVDEYCYIRWSYFCVDGRIESDGSVNYFAYICPTRPILRKCCPLGEVVKMSGKNSTCGIHPNSTFNPPTNMNLSNYNILIGPPPGVLKLDGIIRIDTSGNLENNHSKYSPREYCQDTFIINGTAEQSALYVPPARNLSTWEKVRPILLPACKAISLLFLGVNIACHLHIRKLLEHGGVHHLCHSVSLTIADAAFFFLHTTYNKRSGFGCFLYGITMQFGFLATFFWLNVMCFENFMKIRYLEKYPTYKDFPWWYYMVYAFGIPLLISFITVIIQYLAPDDVPGLIKPAIGEGKCWFKGNMNLLAYFNGPAIFLFICNLVLLALTYYDFNKMMQSHREHENILKEDGIEVRTDLSELTSKNNILKPQDYIYEIRQKLMLFALMISCWATDFIYWDKLPIEIWALTNTLNSLHGFFIFIIFITNRNKRKLLSEKFPAIFKVRNTTKNILQKIRERLCRGANQNVPTLTFLVAALNNMFTLTVSSTTDSNNSPLSVLSSSSYSNNHCPATKDENHDV